MPETNLNTKTPSSQEQLAEKSGLNPERLDDNKPLLLQIVEQFQKGEMGRGGNTRTQISH